MKKRILLLMIPFLLFALCTVSSVAAGGTDSTVTVAGTAYDINAQELTLADVTAQELAEKLPLFSGLQTVRLEGTLPETDALLQLKGDFPHIRFIWDLSVCGVATDTGAEFLDLSGIPLENADELVAALPCFYDLKQVDMIDCGISNDDMEALNRNHPGTKFVWAVQLQGIKLRTDATSFMPTKEGYRVNTADCELLWYCHDLECIDLGHMPVYDCSFLYGTPHVKYLIFADTPISDATPIGFLTELEFLELFMTKVTDYSPLINCTSLRDLNLCFSTSQDNAPLTQMVWLDRLWLVCTTLNYEEQEALRRQLPSTYIMIYSQSSTNHGWRNGPRYYAQRDIFEMPYNYT